MKEVSNDSNADRPKKKVWRPLGARPCTAPALSNEDRIGERTSSEPDFPTSPPNLSSLSSSSQLSFLEHFDNDDGKPSGDIQRDVLRTLKLVRQGRHLVADDLYQNVKARMDSFKPKIDLHRDGGGSGKEEKAFESSGHKAAQNFTAAGHAIERQMEEFNKLEHRALLLRSAKRNLTLDDDWILSHQTDSRHQTSSSFKTYYRREEDRSLSIKLEGELNEAPLLELLAVTREIDLFHHWASCCTESKKLGELGRYDVLGWQKISTFGLVRDACYRAIGCDSLAEDGCIIITARSLVDDNSESSADNSDPQLNGLDASSYSIPSDVNTKKDNKYIGSYFVREPLLKKFKLPPKPTGFGAARMNLRKFECVVHVASPDSTRTCIICNIETGTPLLPQALIDFCLKKICATMLPNLELAAISADIDPKSSVHAERMRKDSHFYKEWCMPKMKHYFAANGWEMPPIHTFSHLGNPVVDNEVDSDNSEASASASESISVKSVPITSLMPENMIRPGEKSFTKEQVLRIREMKNMLRTQARTEMSKSVMMASKSTRLNSLGSLSNGALETLNGIPQVYLFPGLFVISAIVLPTNLDKYLAHPDPEETFIAFVISNLTTTVVALLALIILITTHCAVITIACVSAVNDVEMWNEELTNTRYLLIAKIRFGARCFSGGISAFAITKAMVIFVSRNLHYLYNKLSAEAVALWEPIKTIGVGDRFNVAIVAERIQTVVRVPSTTLSFLLSPLLHRLGFMSGVIERLRPDSAKYFFWMNAVYGTQVGLLYTAIFILISICVAKNMYTSMNKNDPNKNNDAQGPTSPERGNLYKIEENSTSAEGSTSRMTERFPSRLSSSLHDLSSEDETSTITTKSRNKRKKMKVKNMFKFMKKNKTKEHVSVGGEVRSVPSPIRVRTKME